MLALPIVLRQLSDVCDACVPARRREVAFATVHAPAFATGHIVERCDYSLFAGVYTATPIMLQLEVARKRLRWRSLQLARNEAASDSFVELSECAHAVERDVELAGQASGGGGGGMTAALRAAASGSPPRRVRALDLTDVRGRALLTVTSRDARLLQRVSLAVREALEISRTPHNTVFPSDADVSRVQSEEAAADEQRSARLAEAEARAKARADARAQLGDVGMKHTARIMLERAASKPHASSGPTSHTHAHTRSAPSAAPQTQEESSVTAGLHRFANGASSFFSSLAEPPARSSAAVTRHAQATSTNPGTNDFGVSTAGAARTLASISSSLGALSRSAVGALGATVR